MPRDYRDGVIDALACSEAALLDQVVELTIDRDSWRAVARAAIAHTSELTRELEMIDRRRYVHKIQTGAQRPDEMRRRQEAA